MWTVGPRREILAHAPYHSVPPVQRPKQSFLHNLGRFPAISMGLCGTERGLVLLFRIPKVERSNPISRHPKSFLELSLGCPRPKICYVTRFQKYYFRALNLGASPQNGNGYPLFAFWCIFSGFQSSLLSLSPLGPCFAQIIPILGNMKVLWKFQRESLTPSLHTHGLSYAVLAVLAFGSPFFWHFLKFYWSLVPGNLVWCSRHSYYVYA